MSELLTPHEWIAGTVQPHCWRDPLKLALEGPPELAPGPHPRHTTCCVCHTHFYLAEATTDQLAIILTRQHPFLGLGAPGAGKTTAICRKLLLSAIQIPRSVWVLGRYDEDELLMTSLTTFVREANRERWIETDARTGEVKDRGPFILQHHQKSEKYVLVANELWITTRKTADLSRIYLLGLKKGLGSFEMTGFIVDHAEEISESMFDNLMDRCRYPADSPHYMGILAAYPPGRNHWLYKRFGLGGPFSEAVVHMPLEGNPFVSAAYKADVRKRYTNDPDGYRRYVLAQWGLATKGDPMFPQFRPTNLGQPWHIAARPLRRVPLEPVYLGLDFGLTPAATWVQLDPFGRVLAFHTETADGASLESFIPRKVRPYHINHWNDHELVIVGDPSGAYRQQTDARTCFQLLKQAFPQAMIRKGPKEIPARTRPVVDLLTHTTETAGPLLLVDPTNQPLIDAFTGGYCKDTEGLPVKNHPYSDVMDAFMGVVAWLLKPYDHEALKALYSEDQPFQDRVDEIHRALRINWP